MSKSSAITMLAALAIHASALADGSYSAVAPGWVQASPAASPSARAEHAMAFDSTRGVTVLFGGNDGSANGETWEWDGANWKQVAGTGPAPRFGHAMTFRGNAVLFGGVGLGDTWEWDGSSWHETTPANGPTVRAYCGFANDGYSDAVLLGGYGTGALDEVWGYWYDLSGWWENLGALPAFSARYKHAMTSEGCGLDPAIIFGGLTSEGALIGETWGIASEDGGLRLLATSGPPARCSAALSKSGFGRAVLFGGEGESGLLDDVWEWNGSQWDQLVFTTAPSARKGHAMVYDSVRNVLVMFGGETESGLSNETWELDLASSGEPSSVLQAPPRAAVVGRDLFYNNATAWFGAFPNTIDTGKQPLIHGSADYSTQMLNHSGYSKGLNGICVDIQSATEPTLSDFVFRYGNATTPESINIAAPAPTLTVFPNTPVAGTYRCKFTWPDYPASPTGSFTGMIPNRNWLLVVTRTSTGLPLLGPTYPSWLTTQGIADAGDYFFYGICAYDMGENNSATSIQVTTSDWNNCYSHRVSPPNHTAITENRDVTKDSFVTTSDWNSAYTWRTANPSVGLKILVVP